jgi:glycosyltransferase involved in cell wall biosynthesis
VLLPLGVDVQRFQAEDRPPPAEHLRVGFVGRLIPHKGVDVLLEAVAGDARFSVDIFGAGPEADRLAGEAVRLGAADRVVFHGHVDEESVPGTYRRFDVLAVPSVPMPGWLEQFGRVVVEAQASGVPVVASASGALPDVVGDSGLLVPPRDPDALRAALGRLLDQPGLWSHLRESGLAGAHRYSWESVAETQMALYRSAVGEPGPP